MRKYSNVKRRLEALVANHPSIPSYDVDLENGETVTLGGFGLLYLPEKTTRIRCEYKGECDPILPVIITLMVHDVPIEVDIINNGVHYSTEDITRLVPKIPDQEATEERRRAMLYEDAD